MSLPCSALFFSPADLRDRAIEGRVVVAGVEIGLVLVGHQLAGRERQLGFDDQVLAAEVDRVEPEIVRDQVEQTLAEEVRLEPAGRAQGADRRLARHHHLEREGDVANAVRARQELHRLRRHHAAVGADIGAHVAPDMAAHAENAAVARAGDLELAIDLARVVGRHQVLAAVLDPLHRPAEQPRGERDEEILRIELAAHAEAAADVGLQHVDGVLADAEHLGQHAAVEEQHLGGAEHRQARFRGVPFGDDAARFQRQTRSAGGRRSFPCGCIRPWRRRRRHRRTRPNSYWRNCCRSHRTGASCRCAAACRSGSAGSRSISTAIASSASSASAWVSAITTASGSPT